MSCPVLRKRNGSFDKPVDKTGKATKAPVWQGVFAYFSRALLSIASISKFGSVKHNEGKFPTAWKAYPETTYADALGRHLMAEGKDGLYDPESGMLHAAHAAWNACARLELLLIDNPLEKPSEAVTPSVAFIEHRAGGQRRTRYKNVAFEFRKINKSGRRGND